MTEGAIVETAVCGEMRRLFCRQKSTTAIFPESIYKGGNKGISGT